MALRLLLPWLSPLVALGSFNRALPQGVAAGDTTSDSTVLWARSAFKGNVVFTWCTDRSSLPTMSCPVAKVRVEDPNKPAKVKVKGLRPDMTYFYRVTPPKKNDPRAEDCASALEGKFRTLPEICEDGGNRGSDRTKLRFGVSGDWRGDALPYQVLANAADKDLDFFVQHGDTVYADIQSPILPDTPQAITLDEFRAKHQEVYSRKFGVNYLADIRASTNIYATIDDHEWKNNFAGGDVLPDGSFVNDQTGYKRALKSFLEYNPLEELTWRTRNPLFMWKPKLYRRRDWGREASIFVLDLRSFRDAELDWDTNLQTLGTPLEAAFFNASFREKRTMMGSEQRKLLCKDLLDAQEQGIVWKFIFTSVAMQYIWSASYSDGWTGYLNERKKIISYIVDKGIQNVVWVAADVHSNWVNDIVNYKTLSFDGSRLTVLAEQTGMFEVTTGPVAFAETNAQNAWDVASQVPCFPDGTLDLATPPTATQNCADVFVILLSGLFGQPYSDVKTFLAEAPFTQQDAVFVAVGSNLLNNLFLAIGWPVNPLGLQDTALVESTLISGSWLAAHTFGWTEFEIDKGTKELVVVTHVTEPYGDLSSPSDILDPVPIKKDLLDQPISVSGAFRVAPKPIPTTQKDCCRQKGKDKRQGDDEGAVAETVSAYEIDEEKLQLDGQSLPAGRLALLAVSGGGLLLAAAAAAAHAIAPGRWSAVPGGGEALELQSEE